LERKLAISDPQTIAFHGVADLAYSFERKISSAPSADKKHIENHQQKC
jgi:hypothetical protein